MNSARAPVSFPCRRPPVCCSLTVANDRQFGNSPPTFVRRRLARRLGSLGQVIFCPINQGRFLRRPRRSPISTTERFAAGAGDDLFFRRRRSDGFRRGDAERFSFGSKSATFGTAGRGLRKIERHFA